MYSRVYVEITNVCNMSCSFCHGHSRKGRFMSDAEFSRVLAELEGKTGHLYYHLMGEPLLHPELPSFIKMATARGFKSQITTNGTLLKSRCDELIAATPHKINISLHSFENGDPTHHEEYLSEVSDFAKMAAEAGILVALRLWNNGFDEGKNDETLSFLRESIKGEWADHCRGLKLRRNVYLEWGDRFDWPDRNAEEGGCDVSCYGLRDHFGILVDGTVVPCCLDSDGVICLGNVFEEGLDGILSSDRAASIRTGFERRCAVEDLCRRCGYARRF